MIQFQIRLVYEETSICRLFACFFQASRSFVKDECFFRKYCIIILFHVVLFKIKKWGRDMKRMKKLTLAGISFLSIAVFAACQSKEKTNEVALAFDSDCFSLVWGLPQNKTHKIDFFYKSIDLMRFSVFYTDCSVEILFLRGFQDCRGNLSEYLGFWECLLAVLLYD